MDIDIILSEQYNENISIYLNNLFVFVRDIPYEINDVHAPKLLLERRKWYCVVKHKLLKLLFEKIWVESSLCFVPFSFGNMYLPDALQVNKDRDGESS